MPHPAITRGYHRLAVAPVLALLAGLIAGTNPGATAVNGREPAANASEPSAALNDLLQPPAGDSLAVSHWGITRRGTRLGFWYDQAGDAPAESRLRVLLIGGLDGDVGSVRAVRSAVEWLGRTEVGRRRQRQFEVWAVPCANPDGVAANVGPGNGSEGRVDRGYPPEGPAYLSPTAPEAAYLWRWVGMTAPDLVFDVRVGAASRCWMAPRVASGDDRSSEVEESWRRLRDQLRPEKEGLVDDELVAALARAKPADVGSIPAVRLEVPAADAGEWFGKLLSAIDAARYAQRSPARVELTRRRRRSPREVAGALAEHYGHELPQVEYIPAMALVGRIRLGELTDQPRHRTEVERLVGPFVRGEQASTPKTGSGQAGHLIFSVLAESAPPDQRARYVALMRVAADQMFDERGEMREAMPFHLEMSDALFMGGPILAAAGHWTGEDKYREGCLRHLRFMRRLVLRDDGLYRHSPLDEAAWGRGNGFPALGLALCLQEFPAEDLRRGELLTMFRAHMAALVPHQDADGMWHQVIDHPESYRELSCTCMIGWALARGVRGGWLDREKFEPAARRAWLAARDRITADGRLVDVCTGTGKQGSLRAYYDREALLGRDPRGGAMALLFATELAAP